MPFSELNEILQFCTREKTGTLYRTLYNLSPKVRMSNIQSQEDWRRLPFIDREMLANFSVNARCFAPVKDADYLRASSGTSGKPPLFTFRGTYARYPRFKQYVHLRNVALTSATAHLPHSQEAWLEEMGKPPRVVVFDPKAQKASIRLAKAAGVDYLSLVFRSHIPLIAREMRLQNMTEKIRLIEYTGESCSHSFLEFIQSYFPNAILLSIYGMGEVDEGPPGSLCHPIIGEEPLEVFHANGNFFLELRDPYTGIMHPLRKDAEGELVLTNLLRPGLLSPLIRFRTGDLVRIVSERCEAHGELGFTVLGRVHADFARVAGGTLRADEIARVLRMFKNRVSDEFQLRYTEGGAPDFKLKATLLVETKDPNDFELIAKDIARVLRVAPGKSYADLVEEGLYAPLICAPMEMTDGTHKHRRIVHEA